MKKLLCAVLALAMMMTACLAMAETVEEGSLRRRP